MKKVLLFLVSTVMITGCISTSHIAQTSGLSELELSSIPKGAKEVIVEKDIPAPELYEEIYTSLLSRGHRGQETIKIDCI